MSDRSCWTCLFHHLGGINAIGACHWFLTKGEPPKELIATIVDRGCGCWKPKLDLPPVEEPI